MDDCEIGAGAYYYSRLWEYWSDKYTNGEISEEQMERKMDRYEEMSVRQRRAEWQRITRRITHTVADKLQGVTNGRHSN